MCLLCMCVYVCLCARLCVDGLLACVLTVCLLFVVFALSSVVCSLLCVIRPLFFVMCSLVSVV